MSEVGTIESIPDATVARLPVYLRGLLELADTGVEMVSSVSLAELAGVNAANVRKDLSYLHAHGTRGVGYEVGHLLAEIRVVLGGSRSSPVVIVGVGNLGRALSRYDGFLAGGFPIAGLVDADPMVVGRKVAGTVVRPVGELADVVAQTEATVGIVATPANAAQEAVDRLVQAGIRSILNFAPAVVAVPNFVDIRQVDLATELQILGYHQHRRTGDSDTSLVSG
ncbi:MAG TPA: redox-sensing transcriptional repressor Rex [Acidimicrobiaceae bacterium]|nr:redox-sensing transcriptional repressor Rex [Acidimicrobiaceae bacterium]HAQ22982.1 redox-sensing transcriptional repressor Rex [Acidimicrobiaceae bacterium]HCV34719.1 redox-sensing transcriptional repressor Rex [Acidimicrobiaceae bacterium]|tara:strand:+ start:387 stop:1058 length:672 start_codon:yes stop_codon:yes gene_type:complete